MNQHFFLTAVWSALFANFAPAQSDFQRAAAEPDPVKRAEAVLAVYDADPMSHYFSVREVWMKCGKAALPVLRQLIADENRANRYDFLPILVKAGGKDAIADLERFLRDEQVYWNNLGMNLDQEAQVSRPRFQFLVDVLTYLNELGYRDEHGLVRAVRDRFRDHPLLCSYGTYAGPSPVVQTADALLSPR
jgi:hypothetical protein